MLVFSVLALTATEIEVPVRWKSEREVSDYQVSEIGARRDQDKLILTVKIKKLKDLIQQRFRVGFYLNTDNDVNTGRFPGQSGFDLQFNLNVFARTMSGIDWKGNKRQPLTLYDDDYLIEINDDVLYLAVRMEALKSIIFGEQLTLRVMPTSPGFELKQVSQSLDMTQQYGTVSPVLNFIRFGSVREGRRKLDEAVLIRETPQYRIWNNFGERFRPKDPVPAMVATDPVLRLKAARNEKESAHFTITAAQPLKTLEVAVSPLTGPNGFRIEPGQVQYPGFIANDRDEIFTDILYDQYQPQNSGHHFIMLTFEVPSGAPAGIYRGNVSVKLDGQAIETVPLELEVYDFSLPEKTGFRTAFAIKRSHIATLFKNPKIAELQRQLLWKLCREYRVSPRLMGTSPKFHLKDDTLQIDWTGFDQTAAAYFNDYKFTVYQPAQGQLGSHDRFYRFSNTFKVDMKPDDPLFNRLWTQYIRQLCDHHRAHGWFDRMLFVIWDEPYTVWNEINLAAAAAKKVEPDLPIGVFIDHYEPAIAENIDIWLFGNFAPVGYMLNNKDLKEKRLWVYNSGGMDNFRISAADIRAYYWLAEKYRLEGYLNSEINSYQSLLFQPDMVRNMYPGHLWMYPTADGKKLMGSLRLIHTRDGLDDYDYLALYRTLLRKHGEKMPPDIAERLPNLKPDGQIILPISSNRELLIYRDRIAREIIRLSGK